MSDETSSTDVLGEGKLSTKSHISPIRKLSKIVSKTNSVESKENQDGKSRKSSKMRVHFSQNTQKRPLTQSVQNISTMKKIPANVDTLGFQTSDKLQCVSSHKLPRSVRYDGKRYVDLLYISQKTGKR